MSISKPAKAVTKRRSSAATADTRLWKWGAGTVAAGAALAGAALYNRSRTRQAEADNPPLGKFVTVDGVRLHYLERGQGAPLVLLHGNGTMIEDWLTSGVFDALATDHRVIAFDRPGFGHSERPRSRIWTPAAQAALIAAAIAELGIERPVVIGHSFGTQVAVALALDHPESVSRLVLLAGYYYPTVRADVMVAGQPAIQVIGDLMRHTVSPLIGSAVTPLINARIFAPAEVPARWTEDFPLSMTLRPSQIRAEAADAALMIPASVGLSRRYGELTLPVTIVVGDGDKLVSPQRHSRHLHETLPQSRLVEIEDVGHMLHYSATDRVVAAIRAS